MAQQSSDTTVFLEWNNDLNAWLCPTLAISYCKLQAVVTRSNTGLEQLSKDKYHLQIPNGAAPRIMWTGSDDERPPLAYALIAVRPKPPETFLGIPVTVFPAIVAAAVGLMTGWSANFSDTPEKISELEKKIVSVEKERDSVQKQLGTVQINLSATTESLQKLQEQQEALSPYFYQHQTEHNLLVDRPSSERVLYLFGMSHGLRLEAYDRDNQDTPVLRDSNIATEKYYMQTLLGDGIDLHVFTKGKIMGQTAAARVLGFAEPSTLNAETLERDQ